MPVREPQQIKASTNPRLLRSKNKIYHWSAQCNDADTLAFFMLRTISENNSRVLTFVINSLVYDFHLWTCTVGGSNFELYFTEQNKRAFLSTSYSKSIRPIHQLIGPRYWGQIQKNFISLYFSISKAGRHTIKQYICILGMTLQHHLPLILTFFISFV